MGRCYSLDKLKAVCAFLIVCIHAPFPGEFGEYFTALTRIAVPVFFMISGFFWSPDKSRKQIGKIFWLMVLSNLMYFIFGIARAWLNHEFLFYMQATITGENLLRFLIWNDSPFAAHLWYLGAILYVLILFAFFDKLGWVKTLVLLSPLFLLVDLALGKYSLVLFHREFSPVFVRNWVFVGIPYFSIGLLIRRNKDVLKEKLHEITTVICMILFAAASLLERYFLVAHSVNATRDHYISSTILAVFVFCFFLFYVKNEDGLLARVGREASTGVYVIHYAVFIVLNMVLSRTPVNSLYKIVRPFAVYVLSVCAVAAAIRALRKNKMRKSMNGI